MTPSSETLQCPRGHQSTEADYCSECGAKLRGAADPPEAAGPTTGQVCPDCGTVREQIDIAFCEVCGYNFITGAHGEIGILPAAVAPEPVLETTPEPPPATDAEGTAPLSWQITVTIDPALRRPESPEPPADTAPITLDLIQPVNLIGRRDEVRGIFPEIPLPLDEAVSRRHALLQQGGASGLLLRDIGAANGTRLNDVELKPMVDYPVKDGDQITLGHWTRVLVHGH